MSRLQHPPLAAPMATPAAPLSGLAMAPSGLPVQHMGREICADLKALETREWLITNGIGGYAGGSLAGTSTRGYHGLLVAALSPPVGRTLMLANVIETVEIDGQRTPLSTIRWHDGAVSPAGWIAMTSITFEGTLPTWRFTGQGFTLEKTVFMDHGANVTRIDYRIAQATGPLKLRVEPLTDFRDYHGRSFAGGPLPQITAEGRTLTVAGPDGPAGDLHMCLETATSAVRAGNFLDFDLARERDRGLTDREDHVHAGYLECWLNQGETIQFVASAGEPVGPDSRARSRALARESETLSVFQGSGTQGTDGPGRKERATTPPAAPLPAWVARLALAADQFIVRRTLSGGTPGHSIIAGYHWFADWGRDTMISLPGLTHTCGRPEVAASVLQAFADVVDSGMIPNRFTDDGGAPEYNTVDATFWFIEAVNSHWRMTGDDEFLRQIFPLLTGVVEAMQAGTRYGIQVAEDGLIRAGEPGVQLTWMDAKVGDWVVTPRIGKPIEVNALWLSALHFMAEAAPVAGADSAPFAEKLTKARAAFERFWNPETGHAFDVIDGPDGNDPALRPNQIFAARAELAAFDADQRKAIVDSCEHALLTPAGLRSLAPSDPAYKPRYGGDQVARDGAYHQGTVWPWLIGPFIEAHLDAYADPDRAAAMLAPLADQLGIEAIGTIGEIFEGDAPHGPRGCVAQAWSVAEVLRAWRLITAHGSDR
ncbi:amylo-alpha-1,6-glucosidase [Roseisalinus antarcticus]|uniref:Amylo-alpha-1,6-glucosidase n=1 Tax=Roseisalinus antarcticus TaxID=254357 RepID=A0A1Y5SYV8_9RHOB|nr:amylo-alpha-1,6-glucosidase [Roseisalinus antarcticus]SLN52126.1 Amylo-alpha-1,6-glucosidase [Roseisalinus antarcticus]